MAHKKGVGSSRNGRDSHSQRLGVKRFGGQFVRAEARTFHQRLKQLCLRRIAFYSGFQHPQKVKQVRNPPR